MARVWIIFALALASCGGDDPPMRPVPQPPPDPTTGEAWYSLLRCAACHGDEGEGTQAGPIILNPVHAYAAYVLRTGRNELGYGEPMPIYRPGEVSDEGLELVFDWLDAKPKATTGAELYARFCGNCHGADRLGGRSEKPVIGVQSITESIRSGRGGQNFGDRLHYMPAWSASELSDEDIASIATFLGS